MTSAWSHRGIKTVDTYIIIPSSVYITLKDSWWYIGILGIYFCISDRIIIHLIKVHKTLFYWFQSILHYRYYFWHILVVLHYTGKNVTGTYIGKRKWYSEICLERPLLWETTCLKRPHIRGRRSYISIQLNLSPKTTCFERPYCYGKWRGLLQQDRFEHRYLQTHTLNPLCVTCPEAI